MKAGFNKLIAYGVTGGVRSRLSGGSKSGFLGSAVSYGASWSGAYEAAGVLNIRLNAALIPPLANLPPPNSAAIPPTT
jgi:hypothetical protein